MSHDKVSMIDRRAGSVVQEEEGPAQRFTLSVGQVAASSLAAASAAAIASIFGVAGTIIGTALFSVVATVATAVYEHAGRRTALRLTNAAGPLFERPKPPRLRPSKRLPWRRVALGATLVFGVTFAGITAFEVLAGKPLSALWGRSETGTSVQRVLPSTSKQAPRQQPTPVPTPTPSDQRQPSATPSTTATSGSPTPTAPTGATTSPSPSASPSASPTPTDPATSPAGTPPPSPSPSTPPPAPLPAQ